MICLASWDAAHLRMIAQSVRELARGRTCFGNVAIDEELARVNNTLEYLASLVEDEDRIEQQLGQGGRTP